MMHKYILFLLFLFFAFQANAKGFNYQTAVRLGDGKAISNAEIRLKASIIPELNSNDVIYSEDHFIYTDNNGMINITIGDGVPSVGDWNAIDWSKSLFLKTALIIDGKEQIEGVSSIVGVPRAISANRTNKLIRNSADGSSWELKVNNIGDLNWEKIIIDNPSVVYPKEKWPAELYLVGSFNNWDVANAKMFVRLAEGKFAVQCKLNHGDVIKFTKVRSWNGNIDWSGTSGHVNSKETLKEWGNTPEFMGETNTYMILVDFSTYTLRIYLL